MYHAVTVIATMLAVGTQGLTLDEEKAARAAVYGEPARVSTPSKDKLQSVLVIPDPLTTLYKQEPKAVIQLLLKIVEGAEPKVSARAAGYAMELLNGPGVGRVCVEVFDERTYDAVHKDWETTFRYHWIKKIRESPLK